MLLISSEFHKIKFHASKRRRVQLNGKQESLPLISSRLSRYWLIRSYSTERRVRDWLYPFPDFISTRPAYEITAEIALLDATFKKDRPETSVLGAVLWPGVTIWKKANRFNSSNCTSVVVDIAEYERNDPRRHVRVALNIDNDLRMTRSARNAKKRFQ